MVKKVLKLAAIFFVAEFVYECSKDVVKKLTTANNTNNTHKYKCHHCNCDDDNTHCTNICEVELEGGDK